MAENRSLFNANPEKDALDILRLGIFKLCGLHPESHEKHLELRITGRSDARRLKHQLESLPCVKGSLKITLDPLSSDDWIIRISKRKYLDNYTPSRLRANIVSNDAYRDSFNEAQHWSRLKDLANATDRSWGELHSPVYDTEVVQLIPMTQEPAQREQQVWEMSHQLLGDNKRAAGETRDWIAHLSDCEGKTSSPASKRTAVPSTWATRRNVTEMCNRVTFSDAERRRMQDAFSVKSR